MLTIYEVAWNEWMQCAAVWALLPYHALHGHSVHQVMLLQGPTREWVMQTKDAQVFLAYAECGLV